MRVVIVGGGIVGLAAARLLAGETGGDVTVLEKEAAIGGHQTSHNSGVVHAGIYYAPGSLKARLCRRGVGMMRDFCAANDVPYQECGKLIVATEESELGRLDELERRAEANGVPGVRRLDAAGLQTIEPHARGVAALHSPETAITDFGAVAAAMAAELRGRGGEIRTGCPVRRIERSPGRVAVELESGERIGADRVIVCGGLQSDRLAAASGEPLEPRIVPFRGEYWRLRDERADLVRGLIYPVPDPDLPFLGVHLTRTVAGSVLIGPNALMALSREGYRRSSFRRADLGQTLRWPGTWRMLRQHWRAGVDEVTRAASKGAFVRDAQRYVPELQSADVVRAPAGVRAQAIDRDGALVDDFRLGGDERVVWVRNAPSPAATSSLAIAEELSARLAPA
jgi:L-2-hydroxyglutarate oxidase LhgO